MNVAWPFIEMNCSDDDMCDTGGVGQERKK